MNGTSNMTPGQARAFLKKKLKFNVDALFTPELLSQVCVAYTAPSSGLVDMKRIFMDTLDNKSFPYRPPVSGVSGAAVSASTSATNGAPASDAGTHPSLNSAPVSENAAAASKAATPSSATSVSFASRPTTALVTVPPPALAPVPTSATTTTATTVANAAPIRSSPVTVAVQLPSSLTPATGASAVSTTVNSGASSAGNALPGSTSGVPSSGCGSNANNHNSSSATTATISLEQAQAQGPAATGAAASASLSPRPRPLLPACLAGSRLTPDDIEQLLRVKCNERTANQHPHSTLQKLFRGSEQSTRVITKAGLRRALGMFDILAEEDAFLAYFSRHDRGDGLIDMQKFLKILLPPENPNDNPLMPKDLADQLHEVQLNSVFKQVTGHRRDAGNLNGPLSSRLHKDFVGQMTGKPSAAAVADATHAASITYNNPPDGAMEQYLVHLQQKKQQQQTGSGNKGTLTSGSLAVGAGDVFEKEDGEEEALRGGSEVVPFFSAGGPAWMHLGYSVQPQQLMSRTAHTAGTVEQTASAADSTANSDVKAAETAAAATDGAALHSAASESHASAASSPVAVSIVVPSPIPASATAAATATVDSSDGNNSSRTRAGAKKPASIPNFQRPTSASVSRTRSSNFNFTGAGSEGDGGSASPRAGKVKEWGRAVPVEPPLQGPRIVVTTARDMPVPVPVPSAPAGAPSLDPAASSNNGGDGDMFSNPARMRPHSAAAGSFSSSSSSFATASLVKRGSFGGQQGYQYGGSAMGGSSIASGSYATQNAVAQVAVTTTGAPPLSNPRNPLIPLLKLPVPGVRPTTAPVSAAMSVVPVAPAAPVAPAVSVPAPSRGGSTAAANQSSAGEKQEHGHGQGQGQESVHLELSVEEAQGQGRGHGSVEKAGAAARPASASMAVRPRSGSITTAATAAPAVVPAAQSQTLTLRELAELYDMRNSAPVGGAARAGTASLSLSLGLGLGTVMEHAADIADAMPPQQQQQQNYQQAPAAASSASDAAGPLQLHRPSTAPVGRSFASPRPRPQPKVLASAASVGAGAMESGAPPVTGLTVQQRLEQHYHQGPYVLDAAGKSPRLHQNQTKFCNTARSEGDTTAAATARFVYTGQVHHSHVDPNSPALNDRYKLSKRHTATSHEDYGLFVKHVARIVDRQQRLQKKQQQQRQQLQQNTTTGARLK
jgi:trimeric autotransporter adhesin